ncbi:MULTISPECIES: LysR family transcriptional regulator [Marinobacter]|uniref:LysR family transcriptional regulator n=1 Tax=Marinobacter TaxID=2742 RepID=UPI0019255862|nr:MULTISPECIES: LysR family transcriptional regulator [Marinobacter]MBL3826674.1 LysR family transcriptional regulator [Marinobacter sp. MC3]MBL3895117.1 LysR family transcriptional regulator [Marinobacter sp. MW3]MCD1649387.1 LysR family transcriptional regulator [Marinobacter adhaerens]
MNWQSVKFDWNRARAFLVTAEEGSLSAAAKALGVSQPTLGRQVAALEEELSTALFERGGRGLELTQAGLDLLAYVRAMGEAASSLSLAATGRARSIEGEIAISASEITAAFILPPILQRLRYEYPGIRINLVASNEASDLRRRAADIAIRNFRPTEPDLIARKVGEFSATLFATPEILTNLPSLLPEDFCEGPFIGFLSNNAAYLSALSTRGIKLREENFVAKTDSHLVHWQMARAGIGIGMMPVELGDAEPDVERVFEDKVFGGDVWLVSHRELRMNLRVRTVFDFLAAELTEYFEPQK